MDIDYLNNYSKDDLQAYIEDLKDKKQTYGDKYQPNYLTKKNGLYLETLDARARLGTIETKEALDELEQKVNALENNSKVITPTKKLVQVEKRLMESDDIGISFWTREPVGEDELFATISSFGLGLHVSYDGGKNFKMLDSSEVTFEFPENEMTIDEGTLYGLFRNSDIAYFNKKFFFLTRRGTGMVFVSTDLKKFTLLPSPCEIGTYGLFLIDNDNLIIIENANQIALKINNDNTIDLLGNTSYYLDTSGLYMENRYIKFKDKIFFKTNSKLCIMSDDYISFTSVEFNNDLYLDEALQIELQNNILIVSDENHALFTTDGETWQMVGHPSLERMDYTQCSGGMQILYSEQDNLYYCKYTCYDKQDTSHLSGIYYWEDLASTPTRISTDNESINYSSNAEYDIMKKVGGLLYFIGNKTLYTVTNKVIKEVIQITYENFANTGFADITNPSGLTMCEINGYRYITATGSNTSTYRDTDIYMLDNYVATGDETNVLTVTF